jgi:hypothetical protein
VLYLCWHGPKLLELPKAFSQIYRDEFRGTKSPSASLKASVIKIKPKISVEGRKGTQRHGSDALASVSKRRAGVAGRRGLLTPGGRRISRRMEHTFNSFLLHLITAFAALKLALAGALAHDGHQYGGRRRRRTRRVIANISVKTRHKAVGIFGRIVVAKFCRDFGGVTGGINDAACGAGNVRTN